MLRSRNLAILLCVILGVMDAASSNYTSLVLDTLTAFLLWSM